jgi:hypothetical protein
LVASCKAGAAEAEGAALGAGLVTTVTGATAGASPG